MVWSSPGVRFVVSPSIRAIILPLWCTVPDCHVTGALKDSNAAVRARGAVIVPERTLPANVPHAGAHGPGPHAGPFGVAVNVAAVLWFIHAPIGDVDVNTSPGWFVVNIPWVVPCPVM